GRVVHRYGAERIVLVQKHVAEICAADAHGILEHGLKYRLEIAGRAADDLEQIGRSLLLLQRLGEVRCALAQLVEEARVLDGDHSLSGKIRQHLNLFVGEGTNLLTVDANDADEFVVLGERHSEHGTNAANFHRLHHSG